MSECPNVHDVQMPMMSKCPWCPNVHDVVTLVTCGHTFHMWSQLSQVVTLVTCGLMCHIWSHFSHVVTLVTRNQCFQCWPKSEFVDYDGETRPTYRPARPQVKTCYKSSCLISRQMVQPGSNNDYTSFVCPTDCLGAMRGMGRCVFRGEVKNLGADPSNDVWSGQELIRGGGYHFRKSHLHLPFYLSPEISSITQSCKPTV